MYKSNRRLIAVIIFGLLISGVALYYLVTIIHTPGITTYDLFWKSIAGVIILTSALCFIVFNIYLHYTFAPLRSLDREVKDAINKQRSGKIAFSYRSGLKILSRSYNQMAEQLNAQISALMAERGKLTAVLANMTDGILIVDTNGLIQLINPAAQDMFSVSEIESISNPIIEVVRHHQLIELLEQCRRSGKLESIMLETSLKRLFLQAIAIPLQHAIPGSMLIILQDLTRLRKLEIIRRDFVSNVSHELRTPLASLKALTETLDSGALEDPPAARRFLKRMDDEIDNLTQTVQELLELSKIESKRVPLKQQAIKPVALLSHPVDRMQLQAERAGISLTLDCPDSLPEVYVDSERMQQVVLNLLHNAIKFTPGGGSINVSAYQEGKSIIFVIQDSGVGISSEDLPRIFERFYKADRARSGGGTGLGLSIARHLIEAHGGAIWAVSREKEGSTFYFSLPIA